MDKISDPSTSSSSQTPLPQASSSRRSPAERANDANPQKDGPHRKVKVEVAEGAGPQPPYVIAVVKKDKNGDGADAPPESAKPRAVYDAKELRAKARALLSNDRVPIEQRRVLKEILGPEDKG